MNSYKEYLYYLLHAPFKKVKREANHWKILMEVFGEQFDRLKEYIFLIRDQSAIDTATSSRALDIIGDGMKMKRFTGESDKRFRKRLLAKRAIAEMAGTKEGILYALKSLGYGARIVPVPDPEDPLNEEKRDPERWAEFIVIIENKQYPLKEQDYDVFFEEIRRVKQASSKLAEMVLRKKEEMPLHYAFAQKINHRELVLPYRLRRSEKHRQYVAMHLRQKHKRIFSIPLPDEEKRRLAAERIAFASKYGSNRKKYDKAVFKRNGLILDGGNAHSWRERVILEGAKIWKK